MNTQTPAPEAERQAGNSKLVYDKATRTIVAVKPEPVPEAVIATRGHHRFGPSKLNYLASCAAFKNTDSATEAAEQGTMLHGVMEAMLKNVVDKKYATTLEQMDSWVTRKYELTDEEQSYLRFCAKRCDVFIVKKPSKIVIEIEISVKDESGKNQLNHGYLDVMFVFEKDRMGIIQDFKFGWEPVKPASVNLQGKNYAVGCFQKFLTLDRIGVEFIQPKLNYVTSALFTRQQMPALYDELNSVITTALAVQEKRIDPQPHMAPGGYCKYCALAGNCTALANYRGMAVAKINALPAPPSFKGSELVRAEDVALARYWVEVIETAVDEVKKKAMELAEANDGRISCTLPDGTEIVYEVQEKNVERKLGNALEVAEAFKDYVTLEQLLSVSSLPLGKVETLLKDSMVEVAKAQGEKLTKKAALEQATATLEANGLITRPDGKIRFLTRIKQAKQIEQPK